MGFSKAIVQGEELEAVLRTFKMARSVYSEECSKLTKLRLLAEHPNASDESVLRYAKARKRHKLVCKEFAIARETFARALKQEREPVMSLSDKEYLALYGTNVAETVKEQERDAKYFSPAMSKVMEETKRVALMSVSTKQRFLESGLSLDEFEAGAKPEKEEKEDLTLELDGDLPLPEESEV